MIKLTFSALMYSTLLVLAVSLFLLYLPHSVFLETPDQVLRDQQITRFLWTGNAADLPFMTANEASHMYDVHVLGSSLALAALLIAIAFVVLFRSLSSAQKNTVLLSPVLLLVLLVLPTLTVDFTFAFEIFHQVFFPQGNYAFPANSVLISTYSESFFSSLFVTGVFLVYLLTILLLYLRYKSHR